MSNLFGLSSRVSWCLALACAVLALLSAPGTARADDCQYGTWTCTLCGMTADPTLCAQQCDGQCGGPGGGGDGGGTGIGNACDTDCAASYNQCGNGKCDKLSMSCKNYRCLIKLFIKQCECDPNTPQP